VSVLVVCGFSAVMVFMQLVQGAQMTRLF
jgi:hypothetical protein